MKHLHYGNLTLSISDALATTIEAAAFEFMSAGRYGVWPVACYRDSREEVSVQVAFGPGIGFAISDTYLPEERDDARYTADSIAYIEDERLSLEKELEG